jgi:hypothetical protein
MKISIKSVLLALGCLAVLLNGCAPASLPAASTNTLMPPALSPVLPTETLFPPAATMIPSGTPTLPASTSSSSSDGSFSMIGEPDPEIDIVDAYMTATFMDTGPKILPAVFPSDAAEVNIMIVFGHIPPESTQIGATIAGTTGSVKLSDYTGSFTLRNFPTDGNFTIGLNLKPASGKYEDGSYQATVVINEKPLIVVNFVVGS